MGFNLGNERIQDSYPQLVQISGSTLVNGTGSVIPAITNINSVSSSYAVTASYAEYAVSASYEIVKEVSSSYAETASFANFATTATSASHALYANQAGTATSATTATSASHALYANQAGTSTSATTSTTASYISPTFISASAAAAGFGAGVTPTLEQVTDVGASTSNNMLMTNPNGNQTITITGSRNLVLKGEPDFVTTFDRGGLIGADYISVSQIQFDPAEDGTGGLEKSIAFGNVATSQIRFVPKNTFMASFKDASVQFSPPITASIISASSGFIGNGSGLTNINTAFGAETFFNAADYVIDIPGDANDAAYTVSISQSGVYLISASKVPPYGANGPRVNLQWCPQQLGSGVAKVKFFIPSLDTGTGITYKQSVSCSADYQYIWNSTTSPSSSTSSTIARSLTLPQYSNGSAVTNMIKGGDGYVYFSSAGTPVPSQGYIYTGPSIGLLV
jgi:hypothetical protein